MMIDIIFYICILFPILRIKNDLFNFFKDSVSYLFGNGDVNPRLREEDICLVDLPTILFEALQNRRNRTVDEMCFICDTNYDREDVVCQLSRCGHVFHTDCVGKLLHRNQYNCPYCRSPFFSGLPSLACTSF